MKNNTVDKTSPEYLLKQVAGARYSILLVLIFTAVNLVMLLLDSGRYFLFSASVPYFLTAFCIGMDMGLGYSGISTFTIIALVISAVILAWYLVCWLLSKNRPGWFVAALVSFILDTVAFVLVCMAVDTLADSIMDLLFHVWVIVELIQAISANKKLKNLAPREPVQEPWMQNGPEF